MIDNVPTELDWGDYQADLDQKCAHDVFAGKSNEDVRNDFYRNVIERADELRFMPKKPFQYYMIGFGEFVLRGEFADYSSADAASCFLGLVIEKLDKNPDFILPIMEDLMPAIEYVGNNQIAFYASEEIYGDFLEKAEEIVSLYRASKWPER